MFLVLCVFSGLAAQEAPRRREISPDVWMGVYVNGIKIGFIHNQEARIRRAGESLTRARTESVMRFSRLGSAPMEIRSTQESLFDALDKPLETSLITKMSEDETVIRVQLLAKEIVFSLGEKIVKRIPRPADVVFGVPYEKIIASGSLVPGFRRTYRMLDPMAYDVSECRFQVIGEEEIRILGLSRRLWRVRTEVDTLVPITVDEWIDGDGGVYRSDTRTGFLDTIALRMPREKALEKSDENLDIAFSSTITANIRIEDPLPVRRMELELGGASLDKLRAFPWDGDSQRILSERAGRLRVETRSVIFRERDSVLLPIEEEALAAERAATMFCQSDDPEIRALSGRIVGGERNAWRAAKRIAEWIGRELTPNYDVGFASAKEILRNREGDCSEFTVLFVALCRAAGIPSRAAVGVMSGGEIFAYHMWPEVWVGRWVDLDARWLALDSPTGEYVTDATHLKLGRSLLDENLFQEMIISVSRIIGKLTIRILDYETR